MVAKTVVAAQPVLANNYRICQPDCTKNNMCFEILGFDVLLDEALKPWLLEVNHTPSFRTDAPIDHAVKAPLINDTL